MQHVRVLNGAFREIVCGLHAILVCLQTISVKNSFFLNNRLNRFAATRIISVTRFVDANCVGMVTLKQGHVNKF